MFSALALKEDVIGLDMGDGLAVAARVSVDRQGRLCLKETAWTRYNPKAAPDDIAAALRRMWRTGRLSRFSVVSCLRTRSLALKRFQFPPLTEKELESALRLEAEEALQTSHDNVVLDWHVNPPPANVGDATDRQVDGTLVAVPRSAVDAHMRILTRAALLPVATDVSSLALANLFRMTMPPEANDSVVCLARLGSHSADIVILYDSAAVYPRTVFVPEGRVSDPNKYFIESVKDVLAYYRFKLHLPDVERVYLTGVVDPSTLDMMGGVVDVPVEPWDPIQHVHGMSRRVSRQLSDAGQIERAGVAVAMGLALRGDH